MKKIFAAMMIVCAVLAGGYTFAGYWLGTQTQKHYEALIAQGNQPHIEIKNKSYDRGVFRSTAVTSVTVKNSGEGPAAEDLFQFTLVNSIQHGPVASADGQRVSRGMRPFQAVMTTRLAPGEENGEMVRWLLERVPELGTSEVVTILDINGKGESFLDVPPFQKKLPGKKGGEVSLIWDGLKADSRFDIALNEVVGSFAAPRLEMADQEAQLAVRNWKGDFNTLPGIKGVSVGAMSLLCESIDFYSVEEDTRFRLESPLVQLESGVTGDRINLSLLTRFEKLTASGDIFGPFVFELEFRKLDPESIARFQQDMKEMQGQLAASSGEAAKEKLEAAYMRLLTGLVDKAPEMALKQLKLGTSRGSLDGRLAVGIAETGGSILKNPLLALGSVSANLDVSISEPLLMYILENRFRGDSEGRDGENTAEERRMAAEQIAQILTGLVEQKLVLKETGSFKTSASFQAGDLTVNGRKLNLGDLLKLQ